MPGPVSENNPGPPEAGALAEWRPTETPPKDGTRALVWIDLRGEHVEDRSYARIACFDAQIAQWREAHIGAVLSQQPTHWMPLPRPPAPEQGGER